MKFMITSILFLKNDTYLETLYMYSKVYVFKHVTVTHTTQL